MCLMLAAASLSPGGDCLSMSGNRGCLHMLAHEEPNTCLEILSAWVGRVNVKFPVSLYVNLLVSVFCLSSGAGQLPFSLSSPTPLSVPQQPPAEATQLLV